MRFLTFFPPETRRNMLFGVYSLYWGNTKARITSLPAFFVWFSLGLHLCVVYGMIIVPTLGPVPAPHTFRSSSGRTVKSRLWPTRHWGEDIYIIIPDIFLLWDPSLIPRTTSYVFQSFRATKMSIFEPRVGLFGRFVPATEGRGDLLVPPGTETTLAGLPVCCCVILIRERG